MQELVYHALNFIHHDVNSTVLFSLVNLSGSRALFYLTLHSPFLADLADWLPGEFSRFLRMPPIVEIMGQAQGESSG